MRSALFCLCVILDLLICVYWPNKLAFLDQTNLVMVCDFPQSVLGFDLWVFTESLCICACLVVFICCAFLWFGAGLCWAHGVSLLLCLHFLSEEQLREELFLECCWLAVGVSCLYIYLPDLIYFVYTRHPFKQSVG